MHTAIGWLKAGMTFRTAEWTEKEKTFNLAVNMDTGVPIGICHCDVPRRRTTACLALGSAVGITDHIAELFNFIKSHRKKR